MTVSVAERRVRVPGGSAVVRPAGPGRSVAAGDGGASDERWDQDLATLPAPRVRPADLIALLTAADVPQVRDVDLVGLVVGWQQLIGLAVAGQAAVVRELLARGHGILDGLPEELAAALAWTTPAAQQLVARAEGLGELPVVDEALRDGVVDARKVDVLLDELAALTVGTDELPDAHDVRAARSRVASAAMSRADGRTTTQLRRLVRREVIAVDPAAARTRAEQARARRSVRVDWAPDGMAWVSAFLTAPDAIVVRTVLDAAADVRDAIDPRTLDQRRADAFVSIFDGIASTGVLPCGDALPARQRVKPHIQVTVAATTLLGLDDAPAELAGYGPVGADVARAIAADGTWRRLLTDPRTGALVERGSTAYRPGAALGAHVRARDVTCTFPGCVRPAATCELDHITPYRHDAADAVQTTADNLHAACKRHHDLKTQGLWTVRRVADGGVAWTSRTGITYVVHPEAVLAEPTAWSHAPAEAAGARAGPGACQPPPF
ncbi:HNH endonuclease [Cellulomonas gilvus ATCC 13127]|uniref:HNH endonuclease n=1 Tax=Cellulomonas gilvus (strain ATCC 13127 / NRRL B-14078) TaxID=593907 RepID=F8A124_CELGA|nr:HNH endonuclease [Cellulomonas gilvus ATCC 13127]